MAIASSDIKAWYDFTNGSGTTLTDNSGNGFNGTMSSGATWNTTPKMANFTYSGELDGADDYIDLNHQVNNQATFTVAVWVYHDTISGVQRILHNGNGDNAPHFSIFNNAGSLVFRMVSSGGTIYDLTSTISATTWTHVAISYDHSAGTFTAYKDATSVGTSSSFTVTTNWSGAEVWCGRRIGQANQYVNGKIQQIITMNAKACDATEISSLYNSGGGITYSSFFSGGPVAVLPVSSLALLGVG